MIRDLGSDGFGGIDDAEPSIIRFHTSLDSRYSGGVARRYGIGSDSFWVFKASRIQHPGQVASCTC
ncbi:MAG: hypothetical protein JXC85_05450 [Candidatus Aenigmarchaeota archaeon]|nr:hypothetical protein [Candidatus Aenigmarchaeota archaeon]